MRLADDEAKAPALKKQKSAGSSIFHTFVYWSSPDKGHITVSGEEGGAPELKKEKSEEKEASVYIQRARDAVSGPD